METELIIDKTVAFVKEVLADAEGGHNWYHIERVWNMSRYIRDQEGDGDLLTIELAALLHDISDAKFNGGDEDLGSQLAFNFLNNQGIEAERAEHIQTIVKYVSYKGGFPQNRINSIEFRIVQDADRLDAIGAIGIARAFNYGGYKNRLIYDPSIPLQEYTDSKAYHKSDAPTINHFYEKLLKLKDLMNTKTGKVIALERHNYMLQFLDTFYREVEPGK
ncbi:MAG: phosphohydrolase [Bacteroidetes bacterium]|nr:MAG: phosphohydrolase [Bacteroidota bacterium]